MKGTKRNLKIAFAQFACVLADVEANLEGHIRQVEQAIAREADLIIFPELSLTGYSLKDATYDVALTTDDPRLKKLSALSRDIGIVCGGVELGKDNSLYNTLFYFEGGKPARRHRKVYLPTYGVFEEERYFSPGARFRAFTTKERLGMGLLICEDAWHPASGLILALDGASLLVVSANGLTRGMGGEDKPVNILAWETLIKSLAITTTSYVAFVNRVGVEDGLIFWGGSALVEPSGLIQVQAPYYEETQIIGTMDMLRLRHARTHTTLLSDERLPVLMDEFQRLNQKNKEYD
ncbi:MAG: hypothetical protein D6677_06200 [Calditrichaeota bacterium]|nr:MAG: hypothetical protein D6677_06200 [Calditrichota bacterium]